MSRSKRPAKPSSNRKRRERSRDVKPNADHASANDSSRGKAILAGAVLLLILATMRPVSCPDLWWQAARGREVLENGSRTPSQDLLSDDQNDEADWLGGVVLYLLIRGSGFGGAFVSKVLLVAGLATLIGLASNRPRAPFLIPPAFLLMTLLFLMTSDAVLMLAGRGWDLLLCIAVWMLLQRIQVRETSSDSHSKHPASRDVDWVGRIAVLLLLVLWANLGPLSVVGAVLAGSMTILRRRLGWLLQLLATLLAISWNPRGFHGPLDSLQLLAPWLFQPPWLLRESPWAPAAMNEITTWSFLALIGVLVWGVFDNRDWRRAGPVALTATVGLASQFALPLMSLCILLQYEPNAATSLSRRSTNEGGPRWADWAFATAAVVVVLSMLNGLGGQGRFGVGVAASLEPRLFARAIEGLPKEGVLAWDERSSGLAAWSGLRNVDTRQRALLGGRLTGLRLAVDDLRSQRRNRYLRSDGSLGGWWLWLHARSEPVHWFAVSAEDVSLIAALEPTGFRPLSIDSPVLPYASSFERRMAAAILNCEGLRQTVQHRDWAYQPPNQAGLLLDAAVWCDDSRLRLRQANVFRAMGLTTAALRVLATPQQSLHSARAECYRDLADQERRVIGEPSDWTLAVLSALGAGHPASALSANRQAEASIRRAAERYVQEGIRPALGQIQQDPSAAALFAKARLQLELGQSGAAQRELKRLLSQHPQDMHVHGANDVLRAY